MPNLFNSLRNPYFFLYIKVHYVKPIAREGKDGKWDVSKDQV